MNDAYAIQVPRDVRFGCGVLSQIPRFLPERIGTVLVVSGRHAAAEAERIRLLLKQSGREAETHVVASGGEASVDDVDAIARSARKAKADAILAIGGGSVMDASKAAAAIAPLNGPCVDWFYGRRALPGKGLFFAAVPTTAGTGAEMTNNAVLIDPETSVKQSLRSPDMTADLAVVDPELTLGCPAAVTASSGLDAFVQAVESYASPRATAFSQALSLTAAKKIAGALFQAYRKPDDLASRTEAAEGSMLAGMAFAQAGLGAVHGIAHPIGALLHVPHGVACAILMTPVFRFNARTRPDAYAELARALNCGASAEDFLLMADALRGSVGVPDSFQSCGLDAKHIPFIVANCRSGSMKNNPVFMTDEDVASLVEELTRPREEGGEKA